MIPETEDPCIGGGECGEEAVEEKEDARDDEGLLPAEPVRDVDGDDNEDDDDDGGERLLPVEPVQDGDDDNDDDGDEEEVEEEEEDDDDDGRLMAEPV